MPRIATTIPTHDGACPASIFKPENDKSRLPAVIFFMDAHGIRPVLCDMARRLADGGYLVLLPDLFYRLGRYTPREPAVTLADPKLRAALIKNVDNYRRDQKVADAAAFIDFLSQRSDVADDRFGATGYCMGGNTALTAAGAFPDRFAAVASFHGGNLATDDADSPHRFVSKIGGRVYVAGAIEDPSFPKEQQRRLEQALQEAGVNHRIETYPARHGFAVADSPAFDADCAERHWEALFGLFAGVFGKSCRDAGIRD